MAAAADELKGLIDDYVEEELVGLLTPGALAHEVRPAFLDIRETEPETYDILWKVPARGELRLGIYVELPAEVRQVTAPIGRFADGAYVER